MLDGVADGRRLYRHRTRRSAGGTRRESTLRIAFLLLKLAFKILRRAQSLVGGKLVLVEREADRPRLLDFYRANNFRSWNVRHSKRDGVTYDQMLCLLGRQP